MRTNIGSYVHIYNFFFSTQNNERMNEQCPHHVKTKQYNDKLNISKNCDFFVLRICVELSWKKSEKNELCFHNYQWNNITSNLLEQWYQQAETKNWSDT